MKLRCNQDFSHLFDYDLNSLLDEVRNGAKLFCFGAGKALGTFLQSVSGSNIENHIEAIVDNDRRKDGMMYHGCHRDMPVMMLDQALSLIDSSQLTVVIITSRYFSEIYAGLEEHSRFKNMRVAFYGFLLDHFIEGRAKDLECGIAYEEDVQIPKIIHYCWFGKKKIPDLFRQWMKSWKNFCPDYEIVEWNESNYDVNKHPYMAQAYTANQLQFISDYARLDIVYQYGGVYLDTDVEILRTLAPLMHQRAFMGFEGDRFVNTGLGFGAVPGHAAIRDLRDDYNEREFILSDGKLNTTACPQYQTRCLEKKGLRRDGTYQEVDGIHVYPWTFFDPIRPYSGEICLHENAFSVHHYAGSWLDEKKLQEKRKLMNIYQGFV